MPAAVMVSISKPDGYRPVVGLASRYDCQLTLSVNRVEERYSENRCPASAYLMIHQPASAAALLICAVIMAARLNQHADREGFRTPSRGQLFQLVCVEWKDGRTRT